MSDAAAPGPAAPRACCRRPTPSPRPPRREIARGPRGGDRRAGRRALGDDRRLGGARDLPRAGRGRRCASRSTGPASTPGGATTGSCRPTTRCPTCCRSTRSCSRPAATRTAAAPRSRTWAGPARASDPGGADPPDPDDRGDRARGRRGVGGGRGTRRDRGSSGPRPDRTGCRCSTSFVLGVGPGRARAVRVPGLGGLGRRRAVVGVPAPDPHRAARRAGHAAPAARRGRARGARAHGRGGRRPTNLGRAWAGDDVRELPVGAALARRTRPGSWTRRPPRSSRGRRRVARAVPGRAVATRRRPRRHADRRLLRRCRAPARPRPRHDRGPPDVAGRRPGPRDALADPRRSIAAGAATPATAPRPYAIEREFDDLAAVADALAGETGAPVDVVGHSLGGRIALGASLRTASIRRIVAYEGGAARRRARRRWTRSSRRGCAPTSRRATSTGCSRGS